MDDERALAPLDGARSIFDGSTLTSVRATAAGASHLMAWSRDAATKAVHEASHLAVAVLLTAPCGPLGVNAVSIKGQHSGWTELSSGDDSEPTFRRAGQIRGEMAVALAGGVGEVLCFGEASDGSAHDLGHATELAINLLDSALVDEAPLTCPATLDYGMKPQDLVNERFQYVEEELRNARTTARAILNGRKDQVLHLARIIFEARRLEGSALDAALREVGIEPPARNA